MSARRRDALIRQRWIARAFLAAAELGLASAVRGQITYLNSFGSHGTGNGQFEDESGVAVGPDGSVYVTDLSLNRVEIFTSAGAYAGTFGSSGGGSGEFNTPLQIAVSSAGNVYVTDNENYRVEEFDSSGQYTTTIGSEGSGGGQFDGPDGIAVNSAGLVYVTDPVNTRVEVFSAAGVFQRAFGTDGTADGEFQAPIAAAIGPGNSVYVLDDTNNQVEAFTSDDVFSQNIGSGFGFPTGVAAGGDGTIYVLDETDNRVDMFSSSGASLGSFGSSGSAGGDFDFPHEIAVAPTGLIYVTDEGNNRVERFFNAASWTNGVNTFTNSSDGPTALTVGAGQILGTDLTLNSSMGLVDVSTTVNSGGFLTQAGGSLTANSLSVSGSYLYDGGTFSVPTVSVNAGGNYTIDAGGVQNLATSLSVSGAAAMLSVYGGMTLSSPSITISDGGTLIIGAATISLTGTAGFTNNAGCETQLIFADTSILQAATVVNEGLLDGAGRLTGTLQNEAGGEVSVATGQTLTVSGASSSNAGLISLTGGTLQLSQPFTNQSDGEIEGFGTLDFLGGLSNAGILGLAGSGNVLGSVTNQTDSLIHLSGTQPNIFFGAVANSGSVTVDPDAVGVFYGAYSGSGSIVNDGSLYINAASIAGHISGGGTLTLGQIGIPTTLQLMSLNTVNSQTALTINSGSTLDIGNNAFVLDYTGSSPELAIAAYIQDGAIISTFVSKNPEYGIAYADGSDPGLLDPNLKLGQLVFEPDLLGDADLSGTVGFHDLQILLGNFGQPGFWDQGDFNGHATVDFNDLQLLLGNFNDSTTLSYSELSGIENLVGQFGDVAIPNSDGAGFTLVAVPEPVSIGLAAASGLGLIARRRRIHK
jgi:NHL repeat